MGTAPALPIPSPPVTPAATGLLASAARPDLNVADFPRRWMGGVAFDPDDGCGALPAPLDPCETAAGELDLPVEPGVVRWEPYVLWAGKTCSTLGQDALAEAGAVARRRLIGSRSAQLERELWEGARAQASGWDNRFFTDGTADNLTEAGSAPLTHGLACLQQYLGDVLQGRRGMIHATRQVVTHWTTLNLLRREGDVIYDLFNNVIVPGAGYRGAGPDGQAAADGAVWAYATGVVTVLLDEEGLKVDGSSVQTVDRDTNVYEVRAQQIGLALWDGCALGAVSLDVDLCDVGGS